MKESVNSLYTDRPDTCWGQDVPGSVWVQLLPSPYPSLPAQSPAFQHVLRGRDFLPEWLATPQILLTPVSISSCEEWLKAFEMPGPLIARIVL